MMNFLQSLHENFYSDSKRIYVHKTFSFLCCFISSLKYHNIYFLNKTSNILTIGKHPLT